MKKLVNIFLILCLTFMSFNNVYAAETESEDETVIDKIVDYYTTLGKVYTDEDLWSGIFGVWTNNFKYVTGSKTKDEYMSYIKGFSSYIKNYGLALDELIEFDSSTGVVTVSKDLQKLMISYMNQDTTGLVKVVENPATVARAIIQINTLINDYFPGNKSAATTFLNSLFSDKSGLRGIFVSVTSYDIMTAQQIINLNATYKKSSSSYVGSSSFDEIMFGSTGNYSRSPMPYIYFDELGTISDVYNFSNKYKLVDSVFTITETYNVDNEGDTIYVNNYDADAMIFFHSTGNFLYGDGTMNVWFKDYNTDVNGTYYGKKYINYGTIVNQYYSGNDIFNGDHYSIYNDYRTYITNYYNDTKIMPDDITDNEYNTPEIPTYEDDKGSLLDFIVDLFKDIFSVLFDLIKGVTKLLLDGIGSSISSLFGLLKIDTLTTDIDNTSFFAFLGDIFNAIPTGIKSPFIIAFIATAIAVIIKKLIE